MNDPHKPPTAATASAVGFESAGVVLYQPDAVLAERVCGAHDLAEYIMNLQAIQVVDAAMEPSPIAVAGSINHL